MRPSRPYFAIFAVKSFAICEEAKHYHAPITKPVCYPSSVLQIRKQAWLLVLLSAALQILTFPLPGLYMLSWISVAPLMVAIVHARDPETLQLDASRKWLPARPWQGFLLGYACGVLWYLGTCYWVYDTMHQYGGLSAPVGILVLLLFALYLGLYHGLFGLLFSLLVRRDSRNRLALLSAPFLWVAIELARTRISGFPWDLLGITQVDNIPLTRIATATGVYGLSFEILLVNVAFAATFLVRHSRRRTLLITSLAAALLLQAGRWLTLPPVFADRTAVLLQQNLSEGGTDPWTDEQIQSALHDFSVLSLNLHSATTQHPDLIIWPESPAPFQTNDAAFRQPISELAHKANAWLVIGSIGVDNPQTVFNSASLISPSGEWTARYSKIHLVPFGEYVPFASVFSFAGGLTQAVGNFTRGTLHAPLPAGNQKLGIFICYESIFPNEVRQLVADGADVLVNISNDGWYGDSGAWAQHLNQARMRAIENNRWLLRDTNTGVTASIDPYGRIVARLERKSRASLAAPYALTKVTTFYSEHGDWFAYLCAIISLGALVARFSLQRKTES
ncbi:MAG TPA: apolipoprotein N-acyltransferase [Terriglobales bacterium]|nr:apolipoprotein N-acyltransferase [Terriglobales bacterium]